MKVFLSGLFFFLLPLLSHATVRINEIAWMGSAASASDEWIELYNDGSSDAILDGWHLTDEGNLTINLEGVIPAGGYAVLERTDDNSAPGTAFLIYTGALSNAGALLSLYRDDGVLEDQVVGGDNWENIGGNNDTKETAQYTQTGWITAQATPGTINNTTSDSNTNTNTDDNSESENNVNNSTNATTRVSFGEKKNTTLHLSQREVVVSLNIPKYAYVNQKVLMEVKSSGASKPILDSLVHKWNFGDIFTATGTEVAHRYAYPGEYMVTVESGYKTYNATAKKKITVLPLLLSLSVSSKGEVQIHNNSKYEVDISGYIIEIENKKAYFPKRSIMLPNATIVIPRKKSLYKNGDRVMLLDEIGTEIATLHKLKTIYPIQKKENQQKISTTVKAQQIIGNKKTTQKKKKSDIGKSAFIFASDKQSKLSHNKSTVTASNLSNFATSSQAAMLIKAVDDASTKKFAYTGLFAVIAIGVLAVFAGKSNES